LESLLSERKPPLSIHEFEELQIYFSRRGDVPKPKKTFLVASPFLTWLHHRCLAEMEKSGEERRERREFVWEIFSNFL